MTRPESTKAGEVSINVVESYFDSVDQLFDALGLPEPGPALKRLSPAHALEVVGIDSLDDLSDEMLRNLDENTGVDFPRER